VARRTFKISGAFDTLRPRAATTPVPIRSPGWGGFYAPYCDGYFTDNAMAKLMKDKRVRVEADFSCKVSSVDSKDDFLTWLACRGSFLGVPETLPVCRCPRHELPDC
jgi:hypothetical protein